MHHKKNAIKDSDLKIKMYIDFDPKKQVFYHNFFFEEFNFVLKIALISLLIYEENDYYKDLEKDITGGSSISLKYEKFDLTKYVYLLYYDKI